MSSKGLFGFNSFSPRSTARPTSSPLSSRLATSTRPLKESDAHNRFSYQLTYGITGSDSVNGGGGGGGGASIGGTSTRRQARIDALLASAEPLKALSDAINRDNTAVDLHRCYIEILARQDTLHPAILNHILTFADSCQTDLSFWQMASETLNSIRNVYNGNCEHICFSSPRNLFIIVMFGKRFFLSF
jgi:hypothetical protein